MQRRLVIVLAGLGLVVAVAGGVWLWFIFRDGNGQDGENLFGNLIPAQESDRSAAEIAASDDDNDGLINSEELRWGSDPDKADTDGDGYLDGEEIAAGHDPTIPAPNDELGAAERNEATAAQQQAEERARQLALLTRGPQLASYLREDVSLEIEDGLTQDYENAVPAGQRSQAAREAFVAGLTLETLLPEPGAGELPVPQTDSPPLIRQYLQAADNSGVLSNTAVYSRAKLELLTSGQTFDIIVMADGFRTYRERLQTVQVPQAALAVHTLLLAYAEAQTVTFEQIAQYGEDPVKGLAAIRQADTLYQTYFPIISREFERLQRLAGTL